MPYPPTIAILLGAYNGGAFLQAQLDSIGQQTWPHWRLCASDDGSQDDTLQLLNAQAARWPAGQLQVRAGPRRGFVANFLSMACDASIEADYFAYADQDDIWEPGKLERAMAALAAVPEGQPALYGSRTRYVDAAGREVGLSPLFERPPTFANALTQSIAGGNTMVFNQAARRLLQEAGDDVEVVTHDWWTYLVVAGCGGHVVYDPAPGVRYRQHGRNEIGANDGWLERLQRLGAAWQGRHRTWYLQHERALGRIAHRFMPEASRMLAQFSQARTLPLLPRLRAYGQCGLYRQTLVGNLSLAAAAAFNKL